MKNCGTQRIETDRLILRRYKIEDADAMYKNWASDSEVTKFLTWQPHSSVDVSRSIIEDWLKEYSDEKYYHWAIVFRDNGNEPIGDISVVQMNEDISMVHIGYCLGRAWWRRGIMSEALKAVMDFMFDTVEVNRVESRHDPMNPNSGKVMQKCGMKYEGTLRSADRNNQGICDACYYALLRSER
ncbi:MAG: GNAT family N-acetyltransferase [Clostridium sp.]|nr:GNAT family N-acetyltransferase [Clostridium sp.]